MAAAANVGHKIMIRGKKEVKSIVDVVVVTDDGDRPPDIGQRQQQQPHGNSLKTLFSNKSRERGGACIHYVRKIFGFIIDTIHPLLSVICKVLG